MSGVRPPISAGKSWNNWPNSRHGQPGDLLLFKPKSFQSLQPAFLLNVNNHCDLRRIRLNSKVDGDVGQMPQARNSDAFALQFGTAESRLALRPIAVERSWRAATDAGCVVALCTSTPPSL